MYVTDKRIFKSKMAMYGDTNHTLAAYLQVTPNTVSHLINSRSSFNQTQIGMIRDRYNLTSDELNSIFFTIEVT